MKSFRIAFAMLVATLLATLVSGNAQALSSPREVNCQDAGYSFACGAVNYVPLVAKQRIGGNTNPEYCYTLKNLSPTTQAIYVAPYVVGDASVGGFVKLGYDHSKDFCLVLNGDCPRINFVQGNGDSYTNLGTYPSCGTTWSLPTATSPFKLCATNKAKSYRTLMLSHHGVLKQTVGAQPGQRVCVTHSFPGHWRQELRVWWNPQSGKVLAKNILTDAYYWRLS